MEDAFSIAPGTVVANGRRFDLTDVQRARQIYTIGRTEAGKSTLQRCLILQDIHAGRGVCLIDPHGDNARWLADCVPRHRINDTIFFDAADREHPIGLNPLTDSFDPDAHELGASEMLAMFKGLFRDSWGEWLEYLLKHTLRALLEYRSGAVLLLRTQRMLEAEAYRERISKNLDDRALARFWAQYFDRLREREQLDRVSSIINKTGKSELSTVLRNIVGQSRSGFSIERVVDGKQILLVNLAKGQIGDDNANFLVSLLGSMIVGQVMRRSAIPEEARVPFHLWIDEFQNFTTDVFGTIASEARKYGLRPGVAHQTLDQVPKPVLDQVLKNAEVLTDFAVSFKDADRLESGFRPLRGEALSSTRVGEFYVRTTSDEPHLVTAYAPKDLREFTRGSFERVRNNTHWRFARPRESVQRDLENWYASGMICWRDETRHRRHRACPCQP